MIRTTLVGLVMVGFVLAQEGPGGAPGGPGGPPMGGRGFGPQSTERKVVKEYDKNKNGWLETKERKAAREALEKDAAQGGRRGMRGPGGRGFGGENAEGKPGEKLKPAKVAQFPDKPFFDTGVLRTLFFEFEADDWEKELAAFYGTDVEVPAKLTVDGKEYPGVGVSFRGASSYFTVGEGLKKSFNVSVDMVDAKQSLYGQRTLNLLNAHGDPSFLSTVLYSAIAAPHLPTPKANLVEVVVNGESWGIYCSAQQFNKDFIAEHFGTEEGARWKVKGSPQAQSGLDFIGEDLAPYKQKYQIRTKERDEDWTALRELCRTLSNTPIEQLEDALKPMFDIDSALWFLALDVVLVNSDGYWVRSSDYNIYRDPKGVFHLVPHDMNEAFSPGGGMGGPRGPRGIRGNVGPANEPRGEQGGAAGNAPPGGDQGGARNGPPGGFPGGAPGGQPGAGGRGTSLDPLVALDDVKKPLRSRLLRVPSLRTRYLAHVRELAEQSLDPARFGALVAQFRTQIEARVAVDTRKQSSTDSFLAATAPASAAPTAAPQGEPGQPGRGGPRMSLNTFAAQRREFLLSWKESAIPTTTPEPNRGR